MCVCIYIYIYIYTFKVTVHRYYIGKKNPTDLQTPNFHFTVGETQRWGVNLPKVYRANNSYPNLLTLGPAPSPSLHNNRTMCQALY